MIGLLSGACLTVLTAAISCYLLVNLDAEAKRLLELRKSWGLLRRPEAYEYAVIRRRAKVGYSAFLALSVLSLIAIAIQAVALTTGR